MHLHLVYSNAIYFILPLSLSQVVLYSCLQHGSKNAICFKAFEQFFFLPLNKLKAAISHRGQEKAAHGRKIFDKVVSTLYPLFQIPTLDKSHSDWFVLFRLLFLA